MVKTSRAFVVAAVLAAAFSPSAVCSGARAATPPVVPAAASSPPVEIDECRLLYSGNAVAGTTSGVEMKFTNDSPLTADLVDFRVSADDESATIRDVGTFSPGIEITHHYKEGSGYLMFSPLFTHVHLDCAVTSVHFKNGYVWQAQPAPTPSPTARTSTSS